MVPERDGGDVLAINVFGTISKSGGPTSARTAFATVSEGPLPTDAECITGIEVHPELNPAIARRNTEQHLLNDRQRSMRGGSHFI